MQQTKKFKLDFSAATILALVALGVHVLLRFAPWFLYRSPISFWTLGTFLYDVSFVFWIAACLFRNNKTAFRTLAIAGFAAKLLYTIIYALRYGLWMDDCIDIICYIMMILCVLDVIKGVTAPVMIVSINAVLGVLSGRTYYWSVLLFILALVGRCVFNASLICSFLSGYKLQKLQKRKQQQEELVRRQYVERELSRLKQYYDAKQISEQQYAYWREEILKKL